MACSLACLKRHQGEVHPEAEQSSSERARAFQREMNLRATDAWLPYEGHRGHLTDLMTEVGSAGDVCLFGAGNASDVDVERLARQYRSIHLVDVDGQALARARERSTAGARNKVFLHELDLTGFIDRIDEFSDAMPVDLAASFIEASRELISRLGQRFDVTVSNCALSQLMVPFERMWARTVSEWSSLEAALTVGHLLTLAGSLHPGGRGILAFDAASSARCPVLANLDDVPPDELKDTLAERGGVDDGAWTCHPEEILAAMESVPLLVSLVESPRLTQPWLWNLGDATQLVYGLVFDRRSKSS